MRAHTAAIGCKGLTLNQAGGGGGGGRGESNMECPLTLELRLLTSQHLTMITGLGGGGGGGGGGSEGWLPVDEISATNTGKKIVNHYCSEGTIIIVVKS